MDSSGSPSPSSSSIEGKRWRKIEIALVTTVALALGKLIRRTRPPSRPAISKSSRSASSRRASTASA